MSENPNIKCPLTIQIPAGPCRLLSEQIFTVLTKNFGNNFRGRSSDLLRHA